MLSAVTLDVNVLALIEQLLCLLNNREVKSTGASKKWAEQDRRSSAADEDADLWFDNHCKYVCCCVEA